MGRLSKFLAGAENIVKQANKDFQQPQQQQQQQQSTGYYQPQYQQSPNYPLYPTPRQGYQGHSQPPPPPPPPPPRPAELQGSRPTASPQPVQYQQQQRYPHENQQYSYQNRQPPEELPSPITPMNRQADNRPNPGHSDMAARTPMPLGIQPVTECIDMPFTLPLYWFIHPTYPNFIICSRCYHDHILNSPFHDAFNPVWHEDRVGRQCFFGNPRVKENLWPTTLVNSSLDGMLNFMATRPKLGFCPEDKSLEGREWYYPTDRPDSGLAICKPCYEDHFKHTSFGNKFRIHSPPGEANCDHNLWYIRRMLKVHSASGNWIAFTNAFSKRLQIQLCSRAQAVSAPDRTWFWSSRVPSGFLVCEACYWDYFHDSPEGQSFQATRMNTTQLTTCAMGQVNVLIPVGRAVSYGEFNMFWYVMQALSQQKPCDPQGVSGIAWYTLQDNPPDFDICGACMAGTISSMRMTHLFKPKHVPANEARLCSFNILSYPRAVPLIQKLGESAYINDCRPLSNLVTDLSAAPNCPRIDRDLAKNRRWWGWDDVHICEECYILVAKKTTLEKHFVMKGDHVAESRLCDLYSPRMRQLYKEACQTQQLAPFLAFAQQRRQIYLQTVPEMNRMLENAKHALSQAQTLGLAAVTFSAAGNLNSTNFNYVGYGYGNAQLAQAAMADQQMQHVGAAAAGPAAIARVGMLEKMWRQVE